MANPLGDRLFLATDLSDLTMLEILPRLCRTPFVLIFLAASICFGQLSASVYEDLDLHTNAEEGDSFFESNGIVVMEVESMPHDTTHWSLETEIEGFSGTGYLVGKTNTFNKGGFGTIRYPLKVSTSGVYQLNWKVRITEGDHRGEHNDAFARVLDEKEGLLDTVDPENERDADPNWYKVFMNRLGQWSYDSKNKDGVGIALAWQLEAGKTYFFEISVRSQGVGLDRIVLWERSLHSFGNTESGRVGSEGPMDALVESSRNEEIDTDNDGLPDAYEELNGGLDLSPETDDDFDGLETGLEFVMGTDPRMFDRTDGPDLEVLNGDAYVVLNYTVSEVAAEYYDLVPEHSEDLLFWETEGVSIESEGAFPSGDATTPRITARVPVWGVGKPVFMNLRVVNRTE